MNDSMSTLKRLRSVRIAGIVEILLLVLMPYRPALAQVSSGIPQPVLPEGVGINIHFTTGHTQDVDMIAAAGFKFIRMDCSCSSIEITKGVYNWSAYDELVSNLDQRGLRAILILDYSNPLYLSSGSSADTGPADSADIAAYCKWAAATVAHFEGNHIIWEIWNEPNNSLFWQPTPNAAQYATLALAACKAIRQADPTATIIGPAADRFPSDLLDSVMTYGVIDYLDGVSVHPYRGNLYPETAPYYTPSSTPNDRGYHWLDSLIALYEPAGKNIPVICSEWGYSSSSVSLQTQADYLMAFQDDTIQGTRRMWL
ncbi:MAG: glycoside hydrolase family 5 protein [Bacteroidetes bacterium]|nr:glycoside hydrolase family 5 protein [Bacteroidota bacterium]